MVDSSDLAQVLVEAEDIAKSVSQKLTTSHILLALFTVENRAARVLKEKGIDEDGLLAALTEAPREAEGLCRELRDRARDIAQNCNSPEADCLHLLIAATRLRCGAQQLLLRVGLDLAALRNTALSYYLSGRMPRKLQLPSVQVAGPTPVRHGAQTLQSAPRPAPKSAAVSTAPVLSPKDLVEPKEEAESPSKAAASSLPPAFDRFSLKAFPLLSSLGRNLTQSAAGGRLDPVIGRQKEIEEVIDILGKRRTNNPCLVGEPGVGKTAVVEGVAQRLIGSFGSLGEKIIVELDMATLVAGTQLRGSFSEKLNALKDEVKRADGRVIVFIDEIHTLVGAGSTGEGPQDAANELKSAMARGEFPCIGATTHDEFRKFISSDPALERRFTGVWINEPSVPQTVEVLKGVIPRYEEHHGLTYSPKALEAAASLSARYVSDRFLPDKALSIADLAGSRCRREGKTRVEPDDVAKVVAKLSGIPEERLLIGATEHLLKLEADLGARVIGHAEAVSRIAQVIRRNYAGFASRRPMGSFLFLGPTGVGKTETARALAEVLFGSRDALIQIDMSELSEAHAISRLIGSPAGYVGHGEGGQLTEPVRRRPSSVVLLDEVEKAHREVLMLLLQVLDEGRLTDGKGRHIDFSNAVVILSSNLGAEAFDKREKVLGFGTQGFDPGADHQRLQEEAALKAARQSLPPELWNRIDEPLVFRPLQKGQIAQIASLLIQESSRRLCSEKGIAYLAGEEVVEVLLQSGGFDQAMGARPMRHTLQRLVEAPLAERILKGEFLAGDKVRARVKQGQICFERESPPARPSP